MTMAWLSEVLSPSIRDTLSNEADNNYYLGSPVNININIKICF